MMSIKKTIAWVKWHNPYKLLDSKKKDGDGYEDDSVVDVLEDDEDHDDDDTNENSSLVFFTPLGPVPLNEHNDPEKIFNFWVGHTNFNINKDIKKIINKTDGVEVLNVFTRYRFRIGVGRVFAVKDVTRDINRRISEYFRANDNNEEVRSDIDSA
jgi:hypothetical protein